MSIYRKYSLSRQCNFSRRQVRGQSVVEFALIAPVFFALIFGIINGGLLLYSINSAQQTANIGALQVAALGDYKGPPPPSSGLPGPTVTADDVALESMQNTDFGHSGLVSIIAYKITKLDPSSLQTYTSASCPGPDGCFHRYDLANHSWSGTWVPCGCGARDTTNTNADYARLEIQFNYQSLADATAPIQLTITRLFRMEPQT